MAVESSFWSVKFPAMKSAAAVRGGNLLLSGLTPAALCWTAEDPEALGQTPPWASTARQGRGVGNGALGLQCRPRDPAPACGGSPIPEARNLSRGNSSKQMESYKNSVKRAKKSKE